MEGDPHPKGGQWWHLLPSHCLPRFKKWRLLTFAYFYKRKKKNIGGIVIIAPWAEIIIKTPWQQGFLQHFSLSYQLRQQKQLTFLQMLQGNSEDHGGVRKLLPYQFCWPLSQPKVKNEIHPKHIFSNAVLVLPRCHLLVLSQPLPALL